MQWSAEECLVVVVVAEDLGRQAWIYAVSRRSKVPAQVELAAECCCCCCFLAVLNLAERACCCTPCILMLFTSNSKQE